MEAPMRTSKNQAIYAFFVLLFLGMHPAIGAELKSWNPQDALQLADSLQSASRQLSIECRESPPQYTNESTSGHFAFRYHVRHFSSVANDLTEALEAGKSKEETQPIFDTLAGIMDDLKVYSQKKAGGPWPVVSSAVMKADGILTQLGNYYSKP
jgi:hypothetical protein